MAQDVFGNIIKTALFGKISKKLIKREVLEENFRKGEAVKRTTKVEVKSSSTAPLSRLQKKTKKLRAHI